MKFGAGTIAAGTAAQLADVGGHMVRGGPYTVGGYADENHPQVRANLLSPFKKLLQATLREKQRRAEIKRALRFAGLEPDLYALNSMSISARVRIQVARDFKRDSVLDEMSRRIWG